MQTTNSVACTPDLVKYIADVTTIAYDLCKSVAIDANLFKYKPSVLAAAIVFLALQLQFEVMLREGVFTTTSKSDQQTKPTPPFGKKDLVWQICTVFRLWRFTVLEQTLSVHEIPKIVSFSEHIMDRQVKLLHEYRNEFVNIYKPRVTSYICAPPAKIRPDLPAEMATSAADFSFEDETGLEGSGGVAQTYDARRHRQSFTTAVATDPLMII